MCSDSYPSLSCLFSFYTIPTAYFLIQRIFIFQYNSNAVTALGKLLPGFHSSAGNTKLLLITKNYYLLEYIYFIVSLAMGVYLLFTNMSLNYEVMGSKLG